MIILAHSLVDDGYSRVFRVPRPDPPGSGIKNAEKEFSPGFSVH